MRCPSCAKFVGFDDGNVDEVEVELDEDTGVVTITGRVVLPCVECGEELKELAVDETAETADDFAETPLAAVAASVANALKETITEEWMGQHVADVKYEFDGDPDTEFHERTQTTVKVPVKKKGKVIGYKDKKIKSPRYMKTYKGVAVSGTVKRTISFVNQACAPVESEVAFEHTVEEQSSAFEELG